MQLENAFTVPLGVDTVFDALNDPEKVTPCFPGATLTSVDGDDFTGTVKVKLGPVSMTYKGKGTFVERDRSAHRIVVDAQGRDSRGNGTASAKATLTMSDGGRGTTTVTVLTELQVTGKPAQFGRGVMGEVGNKILGQFASCLADEFADAPAGPAETSPDTANDVVPGGSSGAAATATTTPVPLPAAPMPVAAATGAPQPAPAASTVAEATAGNGAAARRGPSPVPTAAPSTPASPAVAAVPPAERPERPRRQSAEAIDLLGASGGAITKRLVPVAAGLGALAVILLVIRLVRR